MASGLEVLTFSEAVAAMDAGQMVTFGEGQVWFRRQDDWYEYRWVGDTEWYRASFNRPEIAATDWRVVSTDKEQGGAPDGRPTVAEVVAFLVEENAQFNVAYCKQIQDFVGASGDVATFIQPDGNSWMAMVTSLQKRWPAMFRAEG